jgi:hypothetical protein
MAKPQKPSDRNPVWAELERLSEQGHTTGDFDFLFSIFQGRYDRERSGVLSSHLPAKVSRTNAALQVVDHLTEIYDYWKSLSADKIGDETERMHILRGAIQRLLIRTVPLSRTDGLDMSPNSSQFELGLTINPSDPVAAIGAAVPFAGPNKREGAQRDFANFCQWLNDARSGSEKSSEPVLTPSFASNFPRDDGGGFGDGGAAVGSVVRG